MGKLVSVVSHLVVLTLFFGSSSSAQVSVVTQSYDTGRTGQNLQETVLNTSNVNVTSFGKLFSQPVDGYIYGQPLYLPKVTINGQVHNVVYVTTQHDSVYAFDADNNTGSNASPLWSVNLGPQVLSDDICSAGAGPPGCEGDIMPYIGILSTPVIDPATGTMYLVTKNEDSDVASAFWLHALDVTTGGEKFSGPVDITASNFDPFIQLQRPGLLLLNGNVYIAFGSEGDFSIGGNSWHGWVMAYDAQTLQQLAVFNVSPGSGAYGGGIWGGGKGLLTDGTYIYVATSNAYDVPFNPPQTYASSFLKLTAPDLTVADYFAPDNQYYLNTVPGNVDIGSGGPILLPNTNPLEIVGGGKDGILRVMDTTNMGGYNASVNNNLQNFQATLCYGCGPTGLGGMILGGPIFWNSPNHGPVVYLWGASDYIKAWQLSGTTFNTTPISQGTITNSTGMSNLAAMSLSANGSQAGTGIVWASRADSGEANFPAEPGILTAFDAEDLTTELWDSYMNSARDNVGEYAKFVPPTIANGKVYQGAWVGPPVAGQDSGQLVVYGLIAPPDFSFTATPGSVTLATGQTANYTVTVSPLNGFTGTVVLTYAHCPPNATCSFNPSSISSSGSSTISISGAAPGNYGITLTGSSTSATGPISHTTSVSLVVHASTTPDFAITATALSPATVSAGGSATSTISVSALNGFSSAVSLSCSAGLPKGATCSFSPPSVTPGSAPATSTLTISTTAATPGGTSTVTITGTSGSTSHTTSVSLVVHASTTPDFAITATALSPATVSAGGSATSTITITPVASFNGSVSLACSSITGGGTPAPTCSFSSTSVPGSGTSTLTISTTANAKASLAPHSTGILYALLLPIGGITLFGAGLSSRRKKLLGVLLLCMVIAGIVFMPACGGGSSSSSGGGGGGGGTPAGTYTIMVTGTSGSLTHNAQALTLTVQ